MTYHTIGAINERLALEAYARMATIAADARRGGARRRAVPAVASRRVGAPRLLPHVRPAAAAAPVAAAAGAGPGADHDDVRPGRRRHAPGQATVRSCAAGAGGRSGEPRRGRRPPRTSPASCSPAAVDRCARSCSARCASASASPRRESRPLPSWERGLTSAAVRAGRGGSRRSRPGSAGGRRSSPSAGRCSRRAASGCAAAGSTTPVFHWANASYQPADDTSRPVRSA